MNVLSLCDGMACGRIALERAGLPVTDYFASEVDKHAIKVTKKNYPDTIHIGDIATVNPNAFPKIDLLIGGTPCQGFSAAGKGGGFNDPRSALFFEYVRILHQARAANPVIKFLLENVGMKKENENIISAIMGVSPVKIESNLLSPVNRYRSYWANFGIPQPKDAGMSFGDVREWGVPDNFYYSKAAFNWLCNHANRKNKDFKIYTVKGKMQMLEASMYKNYSSQRFFGILDHKGVRYITPIEAERCHGVPDGYTSCVSNTAAYKMLGNGWDVRTITHIFSGLEKLNQNGENQ